MEAVARSLGAPDILINNAGIMIRKDVLKLWAAEFDDVIAVNLRGTFLCAQAAARWMKKRHQHGFHPAFMSEPKSYTASKAAWSHSPTGWR